jgi:aldose sugar dehydrogenase
MENWAREPEAFGTETGGQHLTVMRKQYIAIIAALAFTVAIPRANAQTLTDTSLTITQIVSGLNTPTAMAFIGSNDFLVLEKDLGRVRRVTNGTLQTSPVLDVPVDNTSERGLLGIALHPDFSSNHFVYLCYTESSTGSDSTNGNPLGIRVYRYLWTGSVLTNGTLIFGFPVEPGVGFHNGGTIAFGPDDNLYAVTGDHNRSGQLQNRPAGPSPDDTGVIVRLNDAGGVPGNNPFFGVSGMTNVFAYGVRNSFGLTFDPVSGNLWDTENGESDYDEINLVPAGFNSGWREIMGPASRSAGSTNDLFVAPGSHYADPQFSWVSTVAPTALIFLNSTALGAQYENDLFVGDFNNGNLYHFVVNSMRDGLVLSGGLADKVADNGSERDDVVFGSGFSGGISDLKVGPDGQLYVLEIGAGKVWAISASPLHDLAVVTVKAPKKVTLTTSVTNRTVKLTVSIQNRSTHSESIPDAATLSNLVQVTVQSLGACPDRVAVLQPPKKLPLILAPNKKLKLTYLVAFDCANDPAPTTKAGPHDDYRTTAHVDHAALDGNADTSPTNDDCPRAPSGNDKGCGGKNPVTKQLGADILTDVVQKP